MDNFQSILIVIGIIAIVGVSIHGFLVNKKPKNFQFDAVTEGEGDLLSGSNQNENDDRAFESENTEDFTHFDKMDFSNDENADVYQALNVARTSIKNAQTKEQRQISNEGDKQQEVEKSDDIFIFNVVAKDGVQLAGHELLQYFLTSGFRFGERSIFHRHEHSDGTGPILFSIANMMMPGTFNPETMEQFSSDGVTFFLTVPNDNIDIKSSFKMMLTAVEIMAVELDCIVLDSQRNEFTQDHFIEYQDRLAEYNVPTPVPIL